MGFWPAGTGAKASRLRHPLSGHGGPSFPKVPTRVLQTQRMSLVSHSIGMASPETLVAPPVNGGGWGSVSRMRRRRMAACRRLRSTRRRRSVRDSGQRWSQEVLLVQAQSLGLNQFEVLTWLRDAGKQGLRMSDLASRVVLSPSGVTRAVAQLERKGLVTRCVFEGDRRGQLATLTAEGRAVLRQATRVHLQGLRNHFLRHLDRTQLDQLATAMESVLAGEE